MAKMYFIAIVLPAAINEDILKWKLFMKEHFNCQVALRSPAHITLAPPFWMNDILESKLSDAIRQFSLEQVPFEIHVKNFATFKPRVIYANVLPSTHLQTLHDELNEYLTSRALFPIKGEDRPFHPHVTIATRDLHKNAFHEAWEVFKNKVYDERFTITGISLLKHNQKKWDVTCTSRFQNT